MNTVYLDDLDIPSTARPTLCMRKPRSRTAPTTLVVPPRDLPRSPRPLSGLRKAQLHALYLRLLERSWTITRVMGGPSAVPEHVRERYLIRLDKVIAKVKRRVRR